MNDESKTSYLTSAYLPPVDYFRVISGSGKVFIEGCENYQKQSFRSRCHIYGDSGLLSLVIPVLREDKHHCGDIRKVRIDYSKQWQRQHWRAIYSAYKSSPYFDYYQDDLIQFFNERHEYLFDFNLVLTKKLSELLGLNCHIDVTNSFYTNLEYGDFRESIHPKKPSPFVPKENGQYHQVFAHKHGFIPNLSIIDLLFNEGPESVYYL